MYAIGFVVFFAKWYWYDSMNMFMSFIGIVGALIMLQNYFKDSSTRESAWVNVLSFLGQKSLTIYVVHYFFLPDLSTFVKPYIDIPNGYIWQLSLALLLVIPIVAASLLIGQLIERNRILKWLMLGKK